MNRNDRPLPLILRVILVLAAGVLFALNIHSFVNVAGLFPGGISGVALLVQRLALDLFSVRLPYSLLTWALNVVPVAVGFRFIGRRFTILSVLLIVSSGLLADLFDSLFPGLFVTDDRMLCCVFGGFLNAVSVALCLFAESSSGGTDFIAIYISERTGKSAWNAIFAANCAVLLVAGLLFGWDSALYSIIFQFASTQALNFLYRKYSKTTLLIVTDRPDDVYGVIRSLTNHDATVFTGVGEYSGREKRLLYSVVSDTETGRLEREIRRVDPDAFINVLQSKEIIGKFFKRRAD